MNNNKHIHDEDYDFSIKLMVPLLSILVCTICLCATTWAWYTASVSTGVNSIVAGVGASYTVNSGSPSESNTYKLESNETLNLSFTGENAANGYYALIDISDSQETAYADPIASLFINRICAEGENSSIIKKCIYVGSNKTQNLTITNGYSEPKQVSIKIVWADSDDEGHKLNSTLYSGYQEIVATIENETLNLIPPSTYVTVNYLDIEGNYLPASTLANNETQNYGIRDNLDEEPAIISFETEESEFTVTSPEGYLLKKDRNFDEEDDVPYRTYQIEPGEEIEIDVICVKIEEEHAVPDISEEENQETDEVVEVPKETEPTEVTYPYTVNCIDTDSYTLINSFTGESVPGEITIDIPLIDGYVSDSNTTVIKVTENVDANVFTVQYKKLYTYEVHYIDENNNILESVSNQTALDKVEVPLKQFDNKELLLLEGEKADTTVRLFDINKELETNVFEIHYQSIVQSENVEPLSEEQVSSD